MKKSALRKLSLYSPSENSSKLVKIGEASQLLGISKDSLRRWEKRGWIRVVKTPAGTRLYDREQLQKLNPNLKRGPKPLFTPIASLSQTPHINLIPPTGQISQTQSLNLNSDQPILKTIDSLETADFENIDTDDLPFNPNTGNIYTSLPNFKFSLLTLILSFILLSSLIVPFYIASNYLKENQRISSIAAELSDNPIVQGTAVAESLANIFSPQLSQKFFPTHPPDFLSSKLADFLYPALKRDLDNLRGSENSLTSGSAPIKSGSVLAESTPSGSYLQINLDTQVNGILDADSLHVASEAAIDGPLTLNTVPYTFPALQGAVSTFLQNDGAGTLAWTAVPLPGNASTTVAGIASFSSSNFAVSTTGTVTIKEGGVTTLEILDGTVSNSDLANSSVTISPGSGMSGGGAVSLGGSVTITNAGVISIAGTADQVIASASVGAVTLSLPQSIATSSTPEFAGLLLSGSTSGTLTLNAAAATTSYTLTFPSDDGSSNYVLTTNGSGTTSWTAVGGGACSNCILTDPATSQTITPSSATATGLIVAQAAAGSVDVFSVTNNAGSIEFLSVDSTGDVAIAQDLVVTGTTTSTSTLTASNGFTQTTGALSLTATSGSISATGLTALTLTNASGTAAITAPTLNLNTASTGNTAIGNATGTFALTSTGLNVTTGGALTGVASIDTITVSATALTFAGAGSVAAGGSSALALDGGTSGAVNIAGVSTGDVNIAGGSGGTGCTVANASGNLTCAGNITGSSSGTAGFWTRTSTTLSPATANDVVSISGNSGDILTLASTATGAANKALNVSQTGATSGTDYSGYFSNTGAATTNVGLYTTATGATNNYAGIFEAGNVGIGTTTPTAKLHLFQTGALIRSTIEAGDNSEVNLTLQRSGGVSNSTWEAYIPTSSTDLRLYNAGDKVTFQAAGNVGIGDASPTALLTVGSGDLFQVSSAGLISTTPSSNSNALTITGTSITSANLVNLDARNTSGTIFNLAYGAATTLAGDTTGMLVDLNSGTVDATNQNLTAGNFKIPTVTNTITTGTKTLTGILVNFGSGAGINQNGAGGTTEFIAGDFQLPALTQTAGTLNAYGTKVTTPSSITTGGTAYGHYVSATGVGAGTLSGLAVSSITGGAGTEYALNIGTGWDAVLRVGSTTVINGLGITQVVGGGTGLATVTQNGVLYGNAAATLGVTAEGATGQVLIGNTGGAPSWGIISGSSCSTCLVSNPSSDQFIAPTGQGTTGLTVRQTSTASPTDDIFQVTDSTGVTKYFWIDNAGNVSTGGTASQNLTLTPTTDSTALTLVGTNVTSAKNQYINTKNSSGTIFDISYGAAQTLAGAIIGQNLDLSTNVTATNQSVSGQVITLPAATNTSGTQTYKGIVISGGALNENGGTLTTFTGADITIPALTQTSGTLTAYGANITTPSSITTGGTATGLNIAATGVGAGTLYGVNIGAITAGAGTEVGMQIGSGWDTNLLFNDTTTRVAVADGGTITILDSAGNSLCTITDSGSVGDLSCSGTIGGSGTVGFWSRTGTTLTPSNANDIVSIPTTNTTGADLAITNTGIYTGTGIVNITANSATSGDILKISATALTSGQALQIDGPTTTGVTSGFVNIASDVGGSGILVNLVPDFSGTSAIGKALAITATDSTSNANSDYGYYGILTLSGNANKTAGGIRTSLSTSSTTADQLTGVEGFLSLTGGISTGTRNSIGLLANVDSLAGNTGGTTEITGLRSTIATTANSGGTENLYGVYSDVDFSQNSGTINSYGVYVTDGSATTTGTTTKYGLYVNAQTGANANYGAYIGTSLGVGGDTTPDSLFEAGDGTDEFQIDADGDVVFVDANGAASITGPAGGALNIIGGSGQSIVHTASTTTGTTTASAFVFDGSALTSGTGIYATSATLTTGKLAQLSTGASNVFSSGTLLDMRTTSTGLTGSAGVGSLLNLDWSPGSVTTAVGDLFALNIGTNGTTTGSLFNILDSGASIFSVRETQFETSLPSNFTAAGDVSVAYDLAFTNPTASFITSTAPLTIRAGESFASSNLTLQAYNTGQIIVTSAASGVSLSQGLQANASLVVQNTFEEAEISLDPASIANSWSLSANDDFTLFRIFDNGTSRFSIDSTGEVGIGTDAADTTLELSGATAPKFSMSDTGLAHGVTTYAPTDSFFQVEQVTNDDGGARIWGFSDSVGQDPLRLIGGFGNTDPTDTVAAVWILGGKRSGTGITDLAAAETIFKISNAGGATNLLSVLGNGQLQVSLPGTQTGNAVCHASTGTTTVGDNIVDCTGALSDYAERYPVAGDVEYGDIITTSPNYITDKTGVRVPEMVKAQGTYSNVIGVASDNYNDFSSIGDNYDSSVNIKPVALTGRVPVKVTLENGPIQRGDFITTSSTAGKGMKSSRPGAVIGTALEDFNGPSDGVIQVFVKATYADPNDALAQLLLDDQGQLISNTNLDHLTVANNITAGGTISASGFMIDSSSIARVGALAGVPVTGGKVSIADAINALSSKSDDLESRITNQESREASSAAELANTKALSEQALAQTDSLEEAVNSTSSSLSSLSSQIQDLLDSLGGSEASPAAQPNLTSPDILIATDSATYANLQVTSEATVSGKLLAYEASIQDTFKSLGQTFLGQTTIAGDVSIDGTFSITEGSKINAFPTLFLQNSPLASGIDIFNGSVTINKDGLVSANSLALGEESLGEATIPAGQTEISIPTALISPTTRIFLTPTSGISGNLIAGPITNGFSFKVRLTQPNLSDVKFNWLIIGSKEASN